MKFLLTLLLFFALSSSVVAATDNDQYFLPDEVLKEELRTGKSILVQCYTTWCKPCMKMSKEVFSSEVLKEYLGGTYIHYKVDMESVEGVKLGKKYNINTYPTFLIIRKGELVYKFIGAYKLDAFIKILKKNEPQKKEEVKKKELV